MSVAGVLELDISDAAKVLGEFVSVAADGLGSALSVVVEDKKIALDPVSSLRVWFEFSKVLRLAVCVPALL